MNETTPLPFDRIAATDANGGLYGLLLRVCIQRTRLAWNCPRGDVYWASLFHMLLPQRDALRVPDACPVAVKDAFEFLLAVGTIMLPFERIGALPAGCCDRVAMAVLASVRARHAGEPAWEGCTLPMEEPRRSTGPALTFPVLRAPLWRSAAELLLREALMRTVFEEDEHLRVRRDGDLRRAVLMGAIEYTVDTKHKRFLIAEYKNGYRNELEACAICLSLPLPTPIWLDNLTDRFSDWMWRLAVATSVSEGDEEAARRALWNWLHAWLRREVARQNLVPRLRGRLLEFYGLRSSVMRLAWYLNSARRPGLNAATYQLAWQNENALQRLRAESPELFPVFALCWKAERFPLHEGYAGVRKVLRWRGMSKGGWKRLARQGYPAVRPFRRAPWFLNHPTEALVGYFNLVAACQREGVPSTVLARALIESEALLRLGREHFMVAVFITRAAWDYLDRNDGVDQQRFAEEEFLPVLNAWLLEHWGTAIPSAVGWSWFRRELKCFRKRNAVGDALGLKWSAVLPEYRSGNYLARELISGRELFEEGVRMRHCVGLRDYIEESASGQSAIFSIRNARTGRRLATMLVTSDADTQAYIEEIRGFANARSPEPVKSFADQVLALWTIARAQ